MKIIRFVLFIASLVFVSGCSLIPDKVTAKINGLLAPPVGSMPYNRIDVFNNIEGSVMTLHDRGGDFYRKIPTGDFGWVPQNTYFAPNGQDCTDNNVITARFYDAFSGEYLGLFHWQVDVNGYGYRAFHSPYERKQLER